MKNFEGHILGMLTAENCTLIHNLMEDAAVVIACRLFYALLRPVSMVDLTPI
jgi:hypothetical protein